MKDNLEVIVTSGGTISRIDDVRHVGNFSTGKTGAEIAEEFLKNGADVHYIYGNNAQRPFRRDMSLDPNKGFFKESCKALRAYSQFQSNQSRLKEYSVPTFDEYYSTVKDVLMNNPVDVIVLGAAVGDYGAEYNNGKISSDKDKLVIEMSRNPKVISEIKNWKNDVYQVGFKLLADVNEGYLIDVAYNHGLKNNSDLTVANLKTNDPENRPVFFVTPQKDVMRSDPSNLASMLVESIYQGGKNGNRI